MVGVGQKQKRIQLRGQSKRGKRYSFFIAALNRRGNRRQNKKEGPCLGYAYQFRKKIESDGPWYGLYPPTKQEATKNIRKMSTVDGCYTQNYPYVFLQTSGMFQWLTCSVCNVRVDHAMLCSHTHQLDRPITYPRRNMDGSLDMRCAENRAAADKLAAAEALLAKKRAEAEALAAAEALLAKNLFFSEGAMPQPTPAQVDAAAWAQERARAAERAGVTVAAPMPPSALQLAEQLEKAILTEAKRRVEKEKADEEARIQAEAKRRLEAERAAAAQRRNDDVEARIQAAMEALRKQ